MYTSAVLNTAQNSSDNLSSYLPDNHHCLDAAKWSVETSKHRINRKVMTIRNPMTAVCSLNPFKPTDLK